jgi:photosystem II stability/assembly factor-like uncharacterized protein
VFIEVGAVYGWWPTLSFSHLNYQLYLLITISKSNQFGNDVNHLIVMSFTVQNGVVYAGTRGGIFSSSDSGSSWVNRTGPGMGRWVQSVLAMNGNLTAATDSGIFISSNNGTSWSRGIMTYVSTEAVSRAGCTSTACRQEFFSGQ